MKIVSIVPNVNSVKIRYEAVPGAKDYRISDPADPLHVKYAGIRHMLSPVGYHFGPDGTLFKNVFPSTKQQVFSAPALEIEFNGLPPGTTTLTLEAVDAVGPVCDCS